jgi:hypothetical protein
LSLRLIIRLAAVDPRVIHLSRLLHFVRNDGGSRTSLRGNAVTAAIYSELHNLRIEQAKLFIQLLSFSFSKFNKIILQCATLHVILIYDS